MTRQVVGIHSSKEALNVRPEAITEVILRTGFERSADLKPFADFAKRRKVRLTQKSDGFLDKICRHHQGVCLTLNQAPEFPWKRIDAESEGKMIVIALDEITDPHNLGAIMRTSWLMGVGGMLITGARSAGVTPTAAKVASGGAEHVPVEVVTNLHSELSHLKDKGFWVYGLAGEATQVLNRLELPDKVVWVVGSEEKGLRSPIRKVCDELISIPQLSAEASYNASVAAALALYETRRQL